MNNLPRLCWSTAACLGIVGMFWGLHMAISGDHTDMAAHAHLNLLGWVSLALYGTYYRLCGRAPNLLAKVQVGCAILGAIIMALGISLVYHAGNDVVAGIGSIITLISAILFAVMTFIHPLRALS